MIFVTVGTHEQQFNRLMKAMDVFALETNEKIVVQYGYSTYVPNHCDSFQMLSNDKMEQYVKEARIVITHGGPGSILLPLLNGKKPIVVPRQHKFNEHVNDHQVKFAQHLEKENTIIAIYDIVDLKPAIIKYEPESQRNDIVEKNKRFTERFEEEVLKVLPTK